MKSFPETGNFGPSFDSVSQIPGLVPSSSSLLQQMSASLQTSGQAMAANSGAKFPELSITKHESRLESQDQGQSAGGYKEADIQDQLNMLRTMPDFMRMQTTNIQEEEASGEEMEDEENNIGHKVGGEEHLTHSDFIFCFRALRFIQTRIIAGSQELPEAQFTAVFTWVTWTPVLPRHSHGVTNKHEILSFK